MFPSATVQRVLQYVCTSIRPAVFSSCVSDTPPDTRGMVITVANIKGGVGKTLLAVHAALSLADRGASVGVLDADTQHSAARWLARANPSIPVAPITPSPDGRGAVLAARRTLAQLTPPPAHVVTDAPAARVDVIRTLVALADRVVIPVGPSAEDVFVSAQTLALVLDESSARPTPIDVVAVPVRIAPRSSVGRDALDACRVLGCRCTENYLPVRAAYVDAPGQGLPVWSLGSPARDAAQEMRALLVELFADVQV